MISCSLWAPEGERNKMQWAKRDDLIFHSFNKICCCFFSSSLNPCWTCIENYNLVLFRWITPTVNMFGSLVNTGSTQISATYLCLLTALKPSLLCVYAALVKSIKVFWLYFYQLHICGIISLLALNQYYKNIHCRQELMSTMNIVNGHW